MPTARCDIKLLTPLPQFPIFRSQQLKRTALSGEVEGNGPVKPGSLRVTTRKVPIPAERSAR